MGCAIRLHSIDTGGELTDIRYAMTTSNEQRIDKTVFMDDEAQLHQRCSKRWIPLGRADRPVLDRQLDATHRCCRGTVSRLDIESLSPAARYPSRHQQF